MKKLQGELDEKSKELPEDFQVDLLAEKAVSSVSSASGSFADSGAGTAADGAVSADSSGLSDSRTAARGKADLPDAEKDYERLSVFIQRVIEESGLDEYHKSQDEIDGTSRLQNLQELVNSAISYPFSRRGLLDFLDSIELDRSLAEQNDDSADAVTLITLHNTKGLEFNRVIITGLENGIFPREEKVGEELEEERRLFYVGITRAKNELYITSCAMRRLYGRTQPMMPSRFLFEAGDVFKVMGRVPLCYSNANSSGGEETLSPKAELLEKWKKGVRLYNDDYGYGQIVKSDADSGEVVIEVQFENGERKKFMPEYQGKKLDIIKD